MSIFEFDAEKEWKKFGKAEYQYGVEQGIEQGIESSIEKLLIKKFTIEEVVNLLEVDERIVKNVMQRVGNVK